MRNLMMNTSAVALVAVFGMATSTVAEGQPQRGTDSQRGGKTSHATYNTATGEYGIGNNKNFVPKSGQFIGATGPQGPAGQDGDPWAYDPNVTGQNATTQISNMPASGIKNALTELNNEDQRLVDGTFDAGTGTLTLNTEDMKPGQDGDISRRSVTVTGFEALEGEKGDRGATGAKGDTGSQGERGVAGRDGQDGIVDYTRVDRADQQLRDRIEQVNDEDQRLVDGNLADNGDMTLYTEDMDGDSRRPVVVSGVENQSESVARDRQLGQDIVTGDAQTLQSANDRSDSNDRRVLNAANDNAAAGDTQTLQYSNQYTDDSVADSNDRSDVNDRRVLAISQSDDAEVEQRVNDRSDTNDRRVLNAANENASQGDADTLQSANEHSDANDAQTRETVTRVETESKNRDTRLEEQISGIEHRFTNHVDTNTVTLSRMNARMNNFDQRLGRVESMAQNNRKGIAGTAALASIDFVENRPQIGLGIATWDGEFGYAVKGMVPLDNDWHASIGVFGAGSEYGAAASVVYKF